MNKKIFVIGSGLSGLVASTELLKKGYHVTMLDQEPVKRLVVKLIGHSAGYF